MAVRRDGRVNRDGKLSLVVLGWLVGRRYMFWDEVCQTAGEVCISEVRVAEYIANYKYFTIWKECNPDTREHTVEKVRDSLNTNLLEIPERSTDHDRHRACPFWPSVLEPRPMPRVENELICGGV